MKIVACFFPVLGILVSVPGVAQVGSKGITPKVQLEETVYGHLEELNGRFKLRATEVTFAPGATLGPHHHAGPGLRHVAAGELTFIEGGKATVYKAGDYFYESGDIVHTAQNKTKKPARV